MKFTKLLWNFSAVVFITANMAACCCDEDAPAYEDAGGVKVTLLETNTEDNESEVGLIAQKGFRMLEYDADGAMLRQSVWKMEGGKWVSDNADAASNVTSVAAVFPAGDDMEADKVKFAAGSNNMSCVADVTDGNVSLELKHLMAKVGFVIKDMSNKDVVTEYVKFSQPEDMMYDVKKQEIIKTGEFSNIDATPSDNYVIPTSGKYRFEVGVNGKVYNYEVKTEIKANKQYLFKFKMKPSGVLVLNSVACEDWGEGGSENGILEKEDDGGEISLPKGAYKKGTKLPEGYYAAMVVDGTQFAIDIDRRNEMGEIYGIVISNKDHQFVMSLTEAGEGKKVSWLFGRKMINELKSFKNLQEAVLDYAGRTNTQVIIDWCAVADTRSSDAVELAINYEYKGVKNWYLPSAGELFMIEENMHDIPLANIDGVDAIINLENEYWSSTQYSNRNAWYADIDSFSMGEDVKTNLKKVRPVTEF